AFNYGIVLESEGEIKGYLVGQVIFEVADLFYVAVLPESKRCGYGQHLMNYYHHDCAVRGVQTLTLEVRVSNEAAIMLYKKFGYEEITIRPKYYANGEDALLMIRELNK
ncbi:MAG: ribosomal protein S18-alanine N-acetyltransferase, partial [Turicibacter sp.]